MHGKTHVRCRPAAAAALSSPASAAIVASAITPLNIRSGPGPQYGVIGAIPTRGQATIIGCIHGSLWCQVSYNGKQGWAYSQYLTATLSGRSLAVAESRQHHAGGNLSGAGRNRRQRCAGARDYRHADRARARRAAAGHRAAAAPVGTYVVSHPVAPVYLNGEVVEGVGLPRDRRARPGAGLRLRIRLCEQRAGAGRAADPARRVYLSLGHGLPPPRRRQPHRL